ncbi:U11/U12 small nuclear ribonucleoprotein 59 kDa protein isoform X1 [Tripterygium wilfordii]|uniref:U11/U12 small nuclear ribonucleoprotein 59 kDa protein isoform X1 n=1 Tax=Tripterygium wilfordii TaxID=458696 RepID=A0A7J7DQQ2_TRIWF|nr:U11/U12 small nuclear ribonucleoprotein 59 kDa protein [Tripterygium wilfordii]XP_038700220.1 U11/U12 small nuclear ribonucleoprotein 59 kDa protein [Tripterygium wilfordii]XP_038700221.1 U11/U12 small nuclear ribonucleoprotein 59 kDa protein [Tripterygium wilfordii]KAF5748623.1 U11/U12 small nuclear ribonucleoprotein 59 kDa protein isoform X1 [Tripterygium wilfordii]
MNPIHFHAAPPPSWFPTLPPDPPTSSSYWGSKNMQDQLTELQDSLRLAQAMQKELEMLKMIKCAKESGVDTKSCMTDPKVGGYFKYLEERKINLECQESLSMKAAFSMMAKLRAELEPFKSILDERSPWEEKSVVARLANKMHKSKRNKLWNKRKRKCIAESFAKERENFDEADRKADAWRAREIAKDIAKSKVEKMKQIGKLKAMEERRKLESELELVLIVEKLQELQSIRINKLKKQGHFLPEEDDKFLERVRAAVEEEEEQQATADTEAAQEDVATAEVSGKNVEDCEPVSNDINSDNDDGGTEEHAEDNKISSSGSGKEVQEKLCIGQVYGGAHDSIQNLPMEFYHYYHGSNNDMGTLIEVRRTWDAYVRPGGSRIPGHWVQPPPPADEIWASYLVEPK